MVFRAAPYQDEGFQDISGVRCQAAPALEAPTAVCLERNRHREAADRVPDFSIEHMAEVFEWPPCGGNTWEAQDGPLFPRKGFLEVGTVPT